MRQLFASKSCLFVGGTALMLIALAGLGLYYFAPSGGHSKAVAVAQTLGYTDDALLVAYSSCWDVSSQCGDRVVYTTSESFESFQKKIVQLGWKPFTSGSDSALFTSINMGTSHRLTANDRTNTSLAEQIPAEALPNTWAWIQTASSSKPVYVRFYDTAAHPVVYAFDSKRITNNIVEVLYITR